MRLPSSFRSRISLLQARVRYESRPCSRESGPIRERDSCFCHRLIVGVGTYMYMYVSTSQSIVCEWHQFQGLNVMIYRPAPGPWAKLSSHTLNLLLTRLGSRKILFARGHGIRDPEFAVRRRCGGWTLVHTRLLYLSTCIIQLETLFASYM